MWYPLTVTTAPQSEPVSQAEVKAVARIDGSDDDGLINDFIIAARQQVEAYTGLRLLEQIVTAKCDVFADLKHLPFGPVQQVSSIGYIDTDGASQTLATSVYEVRIDGLQAGIVLKYAQTWPPIQIGSRITVTATLGYADVPAPITRAMMLAIADWYENREKLITGTRAAAVDLPGSTAFDALLANFRLGA